MNQLAPVALALVALTVAATAFYTASNKRACECPSPNWHDRDNDRRPVPPSPRRRPDGTLNGESTPVVKRDM